MQPPQTCPRCARPVRDTWLCQACAEDAIETWAQVVDLVPALGAKAARERTNWPSGPAARSAEMPFPYHLQAAASMTRVAALAQRGRTMARQPKGVPLAPYLRAHPEVIARHAEGPLWGRDVERLLLDIHDILNPPPDRRYLGPCDLSRQDCLTDLYVTVGENGKPEAAMVTCPTCGATVDVDKRRTELLGGVLAHIASLREIHRLLKTYGETAASYETLRGLVRHKRILSVGKVLVRDDANSGMKWVKGYRVGDIFAALATSTRRPKKKAATA